MSPHMGVAMIVLPILISFLFLFSGVLSPPSQLPKFWEVSFFYKLKILGPKLISFLVMDVPLGSLQILYGGCDCHHLGPYEDCVQK